MAGYVKPVDMQPFLINAYKTDPLDLELVWNIGIWLKEIGNLDAAQATLVFASRLAPGNALVARAADEITTKLKENSK